jgi:hypothetical protein
LKHPNNTITTTKVIFADGQNGFTSTTDSKKKKTIFTGGKIKTTTSENIFWIKKMENSIQISKKK